MDQRQTFDNLHRLLSFISAISQQKQKAFLLVDRDGLERLNGMITMINQHGDIDKTSIVINDNDTILLKEIIGINGLFRSDYSEC